MDDCLNCQTENKIIVDVITKILISNRKGFQDTLVPLDDKHFILSINEYSKLLKKMFELKKEK